MDKVIRFPEITNRSKEETKILIRRKRKMKKEQHHHQVFGHSKEKSFARQRRITSGSGGIFRLGSLYRPFLRARGPGEAAGEE